ncbi:MAG TPA: helix-turn-helix transcriptional regulator [Steroidobacter sp.]
MKSLRSRGHRVLCAVLAEARSEAGMTQRDLAARLKRPHSYVAKIESGERRVDVLEFIEMARAMRVDPVKLFERVLA